MIFPLTELSKENAQLIRNVLIKSWFWIIIIVLLLLFIFWIDYKLLTGGLLLIFISLKQYILPNLKKANLNSGQVFIGILISAYGIISILTKYVLKIGGIDGFVLLSLLIAIFLLSIYSKLENNFKKIFRILGFIVLVIITIFSSFIIGPLINTINSIEKWNPWFYLSSIIFFVIINFLYFKIVNGYFKLLRIEKPYVALSFSLFIFVLHSGYLYLNFVSTSLFRDFFILISVAFVTVPTIVSSIKKILEK